MNTKSKTKIAAQTVMACILLTLGFISLVYCIRVEDEPGGVSLLLILSGTVWLVIRRVWKARQQV